MTSVAEGPAIFQDEVYPYAKEFLKLHNISPFPSASTLLSPFLPSLPLPSLISRSHIQPECLESTPERLLWQKPNRNRIGAFSLKI